MKKVKNILKLKLWLLLPVLAVISCDTSDDIVDVITNTSTTTENSVFIETDAESEVAIEVGVADPQTITVGVNSNPFTTDTTVTFNVTKDGGAAVEGVDYTLGDATILAGELFGTSELTLLNSGRYEVTVASATETSLVVVGNKAIYSLPIAVQFTITWADPFYDYDLYLFAGNQDLDGEEIASSLGTVAVETITAVPPVGDSSIYLDDWWDDNAGIAVTLTVEIEGETPQIFPVIMDMDKFVLVVNTEIDDAGDRTYTFTAL